MLQLEHEGLLVAVPRRGTRVRSCGRDDFWGHLILREALECQAAQLVCGIPVQRAMAHLQPLAEAADAGPGGEVDRARDEVAFHCALVELTDCQQFFRQYSQTMHVAAFYRASRLVSSELHDSHIGLLTQLGRQDQQAAVEAVCRHIWAGKPDWARRRRFAGSYSHEPADYGAKRAILEYPK